MRQGGVLLAALVWLAPSASWGGATPEEKLLKLVKQAEHLYQSGQYREAAALLEQAYAIESNPKLLYNIAKARDQAGDLKEALDSYQRYLSSSEGTDPQLLKRSALAVERLRGLLDKEEAERKRQDDERQRVEAEHQRQQAEARAAQERATAETVAARKAQEEAEEKNRVNVESQVALRSRQRIIAWTAGGVGAVGIGLGAYFGVTANDAYGQFHSATTALDKDSDVNKTRSNALYADLSFAVGIAALTTAVLVYPKGAEPKISLAPLPNGAALVGSF
jgi:tetratricopeptide (TPR) repeat protein